MCLLLLIWQSLLGVLVAIPLLLLIVYLDLKDQRNRNKLLQQFSSEWTLTTGRTITVTEEYVIDRVAEW